MSFIGLTNIFKKIYNELYFRNNNKNRLCQRCNDGVAVPNSEKEKLRSMQFYEDEWRKK